MGQGCLPFPLPLGFHMKVLKAALFLFVLSIGALLNSCSGTAEYTPKPRGYFRIELPKRSGYAVYDSACPYRFQYPTFGKVVPSKARDAEPCWFDVQFPQFHAEINSTYKHFSKRGDMLKLVDEAYKFSYRHSIRASAIDEVPINFPKNKVWGVLYAISGNAASPIQFFVTDSNSHFMRGALYFYAEPNADSTKPIVDFLRPDIVRMLQTLEWK